VHISKGKGKNRNRKKKREEKTVQLANWSKTKK